MNNNNLIMNNNNYIIYNLVQSTLLSLDNCILFDPIYNNYNNRIIKCILNFNLYQLIDILVTTVYNNIIVECIFKLFYKT